MNEKIKPQVSRQTCISSVIIKEKQTINKIKGRNGTGAVVNWNIGKERRYILERGSVGKRNNEPRLGRNWKITITHLQLKGGNFCRQTLQKDILLKG